MKIPILLIGGGGHALSLIDVIEATDEFKVKGLVEAVDSDNTELVGYEVVGSDNQLEPLIQKIPHCIIAVGQVMSAYVRKKLFEQSKQASAIFPVIISPSARVARTVKLGEGVCIMHQTVISHLTEIGDNSIINNKALIEHETLIGKHCHISTGAIINGNVTIADECFIGSGAIISQGIQICQNVVIGAGTVVIEDINEAGTYVGNPARKIS